METLPSNYRWLANESAPKMLVEALKFYGLHEGVGAADNPTILGWAKTLGIKDYDHDSIPWCGLFMAIVAHNAGKPITDSPLWAKSWASWGTKSPRAALGDVLVFSRPGGGHVGLYVGEDEDDCYHVLAGNQGDAVSIARIDKSRCIAVRRLYAVGVPDNVRPIIASASGAVSTNES